MRASTSDKIDLVLLMLAAPDSCGRASPLSGITRLQKLLYLTEMESGLDLSKLDAEDRFQFRAYHYGPFSKGVYESIDFLANADLITVTKGQQEDLFGREEGIPITEELDPDTDHSELLDPDAAPPYEEQTFDLTEDGKIVAERLQEKLSREDWERIKSIKRKYADRSLTSLLAYVYRTYPESASESEIRHLF